jgi:RNA polymerase sigma factor (sigma-70 family)
MSMATSQISEVIHHFRRTVLLRDGAGLTDGQLLGSFIEHRDETAFAALVRRHGPMVWGVCRRLLPQHDAEDAFQAAFLVLVRKATSIVPRERVANWLYGVAHQTALHASRTAARRRAREKQVTEMPEPAVAEQNLWQDLQSLLDQELSGLPEAYREIIVLSDLEGKTRKEVARQLGLPEGTVGSRLARARTVLAKRLAERGVVFSGSVAAVLSAGSASAPPALVASTIKAASLLAAGQAAGVVSANVAALTEGVLRAILVKKIKTVLPVVLVVAALAGTAGLIYQTQAAGQPQAEQPASQTDPKPNANPPAQPRQQPAKTDKERMVGNWFIMNDDSGRKGEMWVIEEESILMHAKDLTPIIHRYAHRLEAAKDPKQIDITVTRVKGPLVGVIKGIYVLDGDELRLCLAEMDKDRPTAFPEKPKEGEVLILHRFEPKADGGALDAKEKLRVLIDKVLAAHGGEDKLNKLQFAMTIKHSNGYINYYFVQRPKNFRWVQRHRDQTSKMIVILFPEGRRWWTKEPNEEPKEFIPLGVEPKMEFWLDYVKFFGPRQVLRLKDADHKVALLEEEAKIGDRAAVAVQVTGPHYNHKVYFDKEAHLLLKGVGSGILGEVTYSDYKKFDGIPIAQEEHDGYYEPRITDFRVVEKFDAKVFEQP